MLLHVPELGGRVYAALLTDAAWAGSYSMIFAKGQLPPVTAFWSVTAHDMESFDLIENPIGRYAIGDRTAGLRPNADGSLTIWIQQKATSDPVKRENWLPVGNEPFYLIMRTYCPEQPVLDGSWEPPEVIAQP